MELKIHIQRSSEGFNLLEGSRSYKEYDVRAVFNEALYSGII